MKRPAAMTVSVLLTALGVGILHFCEGTASEHHREWAVRQGWPEPSFAMWVGGAAATLIGAIWLGFLVGRGRRRDW
jgi:hypothetical protein